MRHFLLMTALAVGVTATTAAPLSARPRDREDVVRITPNQIVDMADARIAQLKADLRLTPDQDKNWDAFRSALHDMAQRRADRMTKVREQRSVQASSATPAEPADANARPVEDRAYNDRTPDLVTEMRNRADVMSDRADDFRKFADAAGPLYGSLDDRQRQRFLAFVQTNMMDDPAMAPPSNRRRDHW